MANICVTCPTCGKVLEVGAEYDGQEVECGECFQVFVARGPDKARGPASSKGATPTSRRPARRRDDDDYEHDRKRDDYDDYDYEPRSRQARGESSGGASGAAIAGLVVGVIALLTSCCPFTGIGFGVLAMVLGAAGKGPPGSRGTGTAAIALGAIAFLISTGLLGFWFFAGGNQLGN